MPEPFSLESIRSYMKGREGSACVWRHPQDGLCLTLGNLPHPEDTRTWTLGDPIPAVALRFKVPWPFAQSAWGQKPISSFRGKVTLATALIRTGVVTPEEAMETFTLAVILAKDAEAGILDLPNDAPAPEGLDELVRRLDRTDPFLVPEGSGGKSVVALMAHVFNRDYPFPHRWLLDFLPAWLERHGEALDARYEELMALSKTKKREYAGQLFWWPQGLGYSHGMREASEAEARGDPETARVRREEALDRARFPARVLALPERYPVLREMFLRVWNGPGWDLMKKSFSRGFADLGLPFEDPEETGAHYRAILAVNPDPDASDPPGPEPFL
jgi:hypothetical protein